MSKRFLKKLILLFLALFLILGVSACLKTKKPVENNTNQPEEQLAQTNIDKKQIEESNQGIIIPPAKTDCVDELDIECWNTYRNEEYGFEVKYPRRWIVENGYWALNDNLRAKFFQLENRFIIKDTDKIPLWNGQWPEDAYINGDQINEEKYLISGYNLIKIDVFKKRNNNWDQFLAEMKTNVTNYISYKHPFLDGVEAIDFSGIAQHTIFLILDDKQIIAIGVEGNKKEISEIIKSIKKFEFK